MGFVNESFLLSKVVQDEGMDPYRSRTADKDLLVELRKLSVRQLHPALRRVLLAGQCRLAARAVFPLLPISRLPIGCTRTTNLMRN